MIFKEKQIAGVYLIEPSLIKDDRGFFARTFCSIEFKKRGLKHRLVHCNLSWNHQAGTIRGLHLQKKPYSETKIIRCTSGSIFDVVIDLRPESETYLQWLGETLSDENRKMLYIPEGCAHGYQALRDGTEVFYQTTEKYEPSFERGVRWNDPLFNIQWPLCPINLSEKDRTLEDFQEASFLEDRAG